ncbi:MAG: hypothetical protein GF364_10515 [Candidatus Lokiarchaeota archaeon]|nr:hypothetical protein [Candidatus Lokiarchaeota archaeon]
MRGLFRHNRNNQDSCAICHMNISEDQNGEINGMNQANNYIHCPNGHFLHIEPCLKNWILESINCPVCNAPYNRDIVTKFKVIAEKINNRREKQQKQEQVIQKAVEEYEQIENKEIIPSDIDEKLFRSKKLILDGNYAAALNILFDILDNKDPNNHVAKYLIGKVHFLNQRYELAVTNFTRLVKSQLDYPLAYYYMGKSFEQLNLPDKAKWAFKHSLSNIRSLINKPEIDDVKESKLKIIVQKMETFISTL